MKKARAQQLPQPFHNKTSQAEGLHQDPQEAAQPTAPEWPKPDFKPDLAKLSGFGKLFTCKCWLSERVQRQPPANTAFPRASESSLTITKTYKVTIRLLLSLRFVIPPLFFFPWGFGTAPQSSALQRLSRAVSAFCLLKPPNQSLRWEGLGAPAVLVNAHSPQLLFMWPRQSHAIRAIPSPPVQTWLWQLFQLQGHHISLPGGLFFLRGGVFWLWVGFLSPSSPPLPDAAAEERCLPRCLERRGSAVCRHTCTRRSYQPLQAGRQAAAARLPVSHRYTPSRRAPHFLYHSITPKGCLPQAHRLPYSFLQTRAAPTAATLPCAVQS